MMSFLAKAGIQEMTRRYWIPGRAALARNDHIFVIPEWAYRESITGFTGNVFSSAFSLKTFSPAFNEKENHNRPDNITYSYRHSHNHWALLYRRFHVCADYLSEY